jgi:hypothetical protein
MTVPGLEELPNEELVRIIGRLGRIIDYLVAYKLPPPRVRATISVVRVEHK